MASDLLQFPQAAPLSTNLLKNYRALLLKKQRRAARKFIIEGIRALEEAMHSTIRPEALVFCEKYLHGQRGMRLLREAAKMNIQLFSAEKKSFLALTDATHSQGIIGIVRQPERSLEFTTFEPEAPLVALNGISDPGNAGTIVRTCHWFAVGAVLFDNSSVDPYNPKTLRSTVGSIVSIPIYQNLNLLEILPAAREEGFTVYATSTDGALNYTQIPLSDKMIFVFGNEAHGIEADVLTMCDAAFRITGEGNAESLNVAVAAGIILASVSHRKKHLQRSVQDD